MSETCWRRVKKSDSCPICGKEDWCGVAADGSAAICMRVQSDQPTRNGGWLHELRSSDTRSTGRSCAHIVRIKGTDTSGPDFNALARQYQEALDVAKLNTLSQGLTVSEISLKRLLLGWASRYGAWSFPMRNVNKEVVGIRLRFPNARKLSVKGGHEGLFIPTGLDASNHLLVCEGPTDTAAMLDLGFNAVGRPSCTGGTKLLITLVRRVKPSRVVILADKDEAGLHGAERLAVKLLLYARDVRMIQPPSGIKDAREWVQNGAMADEVQRVIDEAGSWKLRIHAREAK